MPRLNYNIKASTLPAFMKKIILWGGPEIVDIRINGERYTVVDDLKRRKTKN